MTLGELHFPAGGEVHHISLNNIMHNTVREWIRASIIVRLQSIDKTKNTMRVVIHSMLNK